MAGLADAGLPALGAGETKVFLLLGRARRMGLRTVATQMETGVSDSVLLGDFLLTGLANHGLSLLLQLYHNKSYKSSSLVPAYLLGG